MKYNERTNENRLGTANIAVFFSVWICLEIIHQVKSRSKVSLLHTTPNNKVSRKIIGIKEFNKRVIHKEKLVIMEDLIVDVSHYMDSHPGGR